MNMLKLFFLLVLLIGALTLKDEQTIDSPMLPDEISNDEETGMKLDAEDEILQDEMEKAIIDASNYAQLEECQLLCEILKAACRRLCNLIPIPFFRRLCLAVCNFVDRFPNSAACTAACRRIPFGGVQGICIRACRICLRNR